MTLKEQLEQIRDERTLYANTAQRVGEALLALMAYAEQLCDDDYLSSVNPDEAAGLITFLKGLALGDKNLYGITADGVATLKNIIAATLQATNITTDYLTVTKKAHFFELVIDKIQSVGGTAVITGASCRLDRVEAYDSSGNIIPDGTATTPRLWRVYWRATDNDGQQTTNPWQAGDQAICYTINQANATFNAANRYYWRLVERVGKATLEQSIDGAIYECHWMELSNATYDTTATTTDPGQEIALRGLDSDAPAEGDTLMLLGHRPTADEVSDDGTVSDEALSRSNAIVLASSKWIDNGRSAYTDSEGTAHKAIEAVKCPALVQYAKITSFSLADCRQTVLSAGGNYLTGSLNIDTSDISLYSHTAYCRDLTDYTDFITKEQAIEQGKLDEAAEYGYTGFLIDHSKAASTTPSDYTWSYTKGEQGESPYTVQILSDSSLTLRNGQGTIKLTAHLMHGADEVTDLSNVHFTWKRTSPLGDDADSQWNAQHEDYGQTLTITGEDIYHNALFTCEVTMAGT